MAYGTLSVLDTLASSQQTVAEFGEDRAFEHINAALAAHNAQFNEMAAQLMETSTDRLRRAGTIDAMEMQELDEFGAPDAQKIAAGQNIGFPLRMYGNALQWTRTFFMRARTDELAANVTAVLDADVRNMQRQMKDGLFQPANFTFVDRLVDNVELPVKRLANADDSDLPIGPNGETFDGSTHTHYLARAGGALAESDVSALITTVAEHFSTGQTVLYINRAQESTVRGFDGFKEYVDARIVPATDRDIGRASLSTSNIFNRAIGLFDGAEVWIKPWIPANYMLAWQDGVTRPLMRRIDPASNGDLVLVAEDERHPLRARAWERRMGVGVWNRVGAAVLFTDDTSYAAPSF